MSSFTMDMKTLIMMGVLGAGAYILLKEQTALKKRIALLEACCCPSIHECTRPVTNQPAPPQQQPVAIPSAAGVAGAGGNDGDDDPLGPDVLNYLNMVRGDIDPEQIARMERIATKKATAGDKKGEQ